MSVAAMDVKVLKIHRIPQKSRIKAFVDLSINDVLMIKGVRVVQGKKGLFVAMPAEQGKNDRWYEQVRCLNQELRTTIARRVFDAYSA